MTDSLRIVLAGDPVPKGRPRFSRTTGHVYTPEKTARYEDRLAYAAQKAMEDRKLFEGALFLHMRFFVAIPESKSKGWKADALGNAIRPTKKPDWDNFAKVIDALNKVVWVDDSQIVSATVEKFYSDQPRVEITVEAC